MNYNNSYGNGYYPYMYGQYGYQQYPQYQGTQSRQSAQQSQQFDLPILDIKFVTSEEAKSYIVFPNTNVLLIDRQNKIAYLKSADNLGQSSMRGFRYEEEVPENENTQNKNQEQLKESQQLNQAPIDTNIFVKKEELGELLTNADINGIVRKDDLKNFITKEEYQNLITQIDNLQRQLKINDMLESDKNGKQTNGNQGLGSQQSNNGQSS